MRKEEKKESIKFLCKYIVYDNGLGFKIINGVAMTPDKGERICKCSIKGKLYDTKEFDELFVTGTWSEHPQYGRSFDVEAYVKVVPKNAKSMRIYLEQGNIKGINDKRAKLIVDKFGDNTFDVLLYQTGLLKTIKGIGEKSIEKIKISAVEKLKEQQMMSSIMSYIQNFHISPAYAKKIYEHYGLRSVEVLKKNPYQLAEDIQGIGFLKADEIALNNGIEKDSPMRVESAVLYTLKQMNDEGDVFGFYDDVKKQCKEFLNIDEKSIETSISNLVRKNKIKEESEALYSVQLYKAETESAKKITKLIYSESTKCFDVTDEEIEKIEKKVNIKYAEGQKEAIKTVGRSNIVILTGGPGTGKSATRSVVK